MEREQCESLWSSELSQLQESQKREYREWVMKVHEDTTEKEKVKGQCGDLLLLYRYLKFCVIKHRLIELLPRILNLMLLLLNYQKLIIGAENIKCVS